MNRAPIAPVSVIVPCYRCANTIGRAIASVAAQTVRPVEVILVDDCSGDDTLEALFALQAHYQDGWIKVLVQPENRGPGSARNAGWEAACQPYIAFLDADDTWHARKIEIQYGWMINHSDVVLTGHAFRVVSDGCPLHTERIAAHQTAFSLVTSRKLLMSNCFPTPSVMLRRTIPQRFVEGKRHVEDYLLWCEICLDGNACYRCGAALAYSYKAEYGEAGLSADLWAMETGELDAYRRLKESGRLGPLSHYVLCVWSMARFVRRVLLILCRRAMKIFGSR